MPVRSAATYAMKRACVRGRAGRAAVALYSLTESRPCRCHGCVVCAGSLRRGETSVPACAATLCTRCPTRRLPLPPARALRSRERGSVGGDRLPFRRSLRRCGLARLYAAASCCSAEEERCTRSRPPAAPALGIFVLNPLLTLIDTAWVGAAAGARPPRPQSREFTVLARRRRGPVGAEPELRHPGLPHDRPLLHVHRHHQPDKPGG